MKDRIKKFYHDHEGQIVLVGLVVTSMATTYLYLSKSKTLQDYRVFGATQMINDEGETKAIILHHHGGADSIFDQKIELEA